MSNKQSIAAVNLGGAGLVQHTKAVVKPVGVKREIEGGADFNVMGEMLKTANDYASQRQKIEEQNMRLKATAVLNTYRQQLFSAQSPDEFEKVSDVSANMLEKIFCQGEGEREFWLKHGDSIKEANQVDTAQIREIKQKEFGRQSLMDMFNDTEAVIGDMDDFKREKIIAESVCEIDETSLLSDTEKDTFRQRFLSDSLLNVAVNNPQQAEKLRQEYLPDDERLQKQIFETEKKVQEFREKAQSEAKRQKDLSGYESAFLLWQEKERGNLHPAKYYALSANADVRVKEDDEKDNFGEEMPLVEAYLSLKNNRDYKGDISFLYDDGERLVRAYKGGAIALDEAANWQKQMFAHQKNQTPFFDDELSEMIDKVFLPDTTENSLSARQFMENKAKFQFEINEAFENEKALLRSAYQQQGGVLSRAFEKLIARKAAKNIKEAFGFEEDKNYLSFADLNEALHQVYSGDNEAEIFEKFYKEAPYAKDKQALIEKLGRAENKKGNSVTDFSDDDKHFLDDENAKQYAENEYAGVMNDGEKKEGKSDNKSDKYFSDKHWNLLGNLESKNRYGKNINGLIGTWGKYQMRKNALIDTGYMDNDGRWSGKDGIKNENDFYNHPEVQEKAIRILMDKFLYRLKNYLYYDGTHISGKVNDFDVTVRGMLVAAHRVGQEYVKKYLNMLEKNNDGMYYFPYNKVSVKDREKYEKVETRMRLFAD